MARERIEYVPLQVHSKYSHLADLPGTSSPLSLIQVAKELGLKSIALTDLNNVYGIPEFVQSANSLEIKPIVGIKLPVLIDAKIETPVILPANNSGLKTVFGWITTVNIGKRILTLNEIYNYPSEAKIIILHRGKNYKFLNELMEEDNTFYAQEENAVNYPSKDVVAPQIYMASKSDLPVFGFLVQTSRGFNLSQKPTDHILSPSLHMVANFGKNMSALARTNEISQEIKVTLPPAVKLKAKITPEGVSSDEYLRQLVKEGLEKEPNKDLLKERVDFETDMIISLGYSDYFLVIKEIIDYCKSRGIEVVTTGSGNNSVVAKLLGITKIPHPEKLLFERFINPDRLQPDIDLQFAYYRLDEVRRFLKDRYPDMSGLAVINSMKERSLVKLANKFQVKLDDDLTEKVTNAQIPLYASTHPSGIIYDPRWPKTIVSERVISQQDKEVSEKIRLNNKIDILSASGPANVEFAKQFVEIKPDNPKVYERVKSAQTLGVTNCDSPHMQNILKFVGHSSPTFGLTELSHALSVARIGPDSRKLYNKPLDKRYLNYPLLYNILSETGGVIMNQDQIQRIATDLAKYSPKESEKLRKMMSEKTSRVVREGLIQNLSDEILKTGIPQNLLTPILNGLEDFKSYGFVEGHAISLALNIYEQAYICEYYPELFWQTIMEHLAERPDSLLYHPQAYLNEIYRRGIDIKYEQKARLYKRFKFIKFYDTVKEIEQSEDGDQYKGLAVLVTPRPDWNTIFVTLDWGKLINLSISSNTLKKHGRHLIADGSLGYGKIWNVKVEPFGGSFHIVEIFK